MTHLSHMHRARELTYVMSNSQQTSFVSWRTHCAFGDFGFLVCRTLAVMAGMKMSVCTALQPQCRLNPRHQFTCAGLCAGASRPFPIHSFAQRTTAQSTCFAAAVASEVAGEDASPQTSEHTNNRATTQQSSGASHVRPCYPTKTINCSDGTLPASLSSRRCSQQW